MDRQSRLIQLSEPAARQPSAKRSALRAENQWLRQQLAAQQERIEELGAKLKQYENAHTSSSKQGGAGGSDGNNSSGGEQKDDGDQILTDPDNYVSQVAIDIPLPVPTAVVEYARG
mgnify:CR=1 FL=1